MMLNLSHIPSRGAIGHAKFVYLQATIRVRWLFWNAETYSAEIAFGMVALGWGIILGINDPFTISNFYVYLQRVGSEQAWAAFMLALGVVQMVIGTFVLQDRLVPVRVVTWCVSFFVWMYIAAVSVIVTPITTAAASHIVMAIGSGWALLRSLEK